MDHIPALDNTFGAAFIGVIFASILYGVSCSQVFYYYTNNHSKKDGTGVKAVVVAALVSDTVHEALICHTLYTYLIKDYSRPQQLFELVWSLLVEVIFNGITALLVQSYFAVRIWKLSQRNLPITVTLAIVILGEFVSVIVYVAKSLPMTTFAELATLRSLSMVVNVLAVVGDVLITVVSCFLLHKARNSFQRTNTALNRLMAFTVQTGMITSFCAIASLISISIWPDTFIYISFYFILGRLYCNSLLATLNVRNSLRGRGCSDTIMSLYQKSELNTPTTGNFGPVGQRPRAWTMPEASGHKDPSGSTHPIHIEIRRSVSQQPCPSHEPSKLGPRFDTDDQDEGDSRGSPV